MNDKDTPWIIVAIVGLYIFYKINQNNTAVEIAQINSTNQAENNPWLTVPGAVSQGLVGIGSILSSFNDLFTSNSITGSGVSGDF